MGTSTVAKPSVEARPARRKTESLAKIKKGSAQAFCRTRISRDAAAGHRAPGQPWARHLLPPLRRQVCLLSRIRRGRARRTARPYPQSRRRGPFPGGYDRLDLVPPRSITPISTGRPLSAPSNNAAAKAIAWGANGRMSSTISRVSWCRR